MKEIAHRISETAATFGMSTACCLGTLMACLELSLTDHDKDKLLDQFIFMANGLVDAGYDLSDSCRNN